MSVSLSEVGINLWKNESKVQKVSIGDVYAIALMLVRLPEAGGKRSVDVRQHEIIRWMIRKGNDDLSSSLFFYLQPKLKLLPMEPLLRL